MTEFVTETINGLTLAGIIFLVSSGFTLVFGVMRVTNLAHGAVFLLGGYVAYSAIEGFHNFFVGLVIATVAMAGLGLLMERLLLPWLRHSEMAELLATLGLVYIIDDLSLAIWGGNPLNITLPGVLGQSSHLPFDGIVYPNSRFFILGVAVVVAVGLGLLLHRTRIGAIVRAGVDDRDMVSALGINVRRVFTAVFVLGAALAGFAGVLGVPVVGLAPGNDTSILLLALAVVVTGGLGSYEGALLGSLLIGLVDTYGTAYFPAVSYSVLFIPLVVVLLIRPQGLLGRQVAT
ncbi:branched-chain amino acid ABC transporter permease [Aciditerrimonas ferrireducens]|jgi:branched-chain amino acid transport system permease protein|uniref:Branched-chain amino acid ABC transporter permease n=1 Tax=Aciditerrimonas ferrireducens TaxID=667306 RepID=A0ABV6BZD1_9ACTN